ncbi:hypothetical protein BU16DRAFT_513894 [Lophium mytilinum]|uniref:Rhodopsin domain-containing protein n=1 Tax=Lophium mytilinum TaxID=390894 RepID=A0A6A6QKB9_9PEZI|nr:hypothetical protein BU16DRAFT_513894 [Lophium mytilinum]
MASPTSIVLPSGVSKPWAVITFNDQGGLIAILAGVAVGFVFVSLLIRMYMRHNFVAYRLDDYTFLLAAIFACCQAAVVFHQVKLGLGRSDDILNPLNIDSLQKASYASDILYVTAIFLCKLSTCFLFVNLTPSKGHLLAIWTILSLSVVWILTSLFLVSLRCHPSHPWTDTSLSTCSNLFARWQAIAALDATTEILLFAMSLYLVWGIQMPLSSKLIVVGAFSCRLPTLILISFRLHYLLPTLSSPNPFLPLARLTGCTQLHVGYAITASIIPYLKPFMSVYDVPAASAYYNVSALSTAASHGKAAHGERVRSAYVLEDLGDAKGVVRLRPEEVLFEASCERGQERGVGRGSWDSGGSRRMIIKKGVEWSVVSERGVG